MAKFESVGSDKFHTRLNGELLPTPDGAKLMAMIGMGSFTVTSEVLPENVTELSSQFAYIADPPCPTLLLIKWEL